MNLERFVIISFLFHALLFVVLQTLPSENPPEEPRKPLIAQLVPPEYLRPKLPELVKESVPLRKTTPANIQEPAERRPVPSRTKLPKQTEPPKTIEDRITGPDADQAANKPGKPSQQEGRITTGEGHEGTGTKGKGSGDGQREGEKTFGEELKLAEQRAVEKVTRGSRDVSPEGAGAAGEGQGKALTFSTKEYKYYGYRTRLKEKIENIWVYPYEAIQKGIFGDLIIEFTILKDGRLGSVELQRTSGYKMLDDAAIKALRDAAPYWPLPKEWKEDSFTIKGHFVYSLGGFYIR